MNSQAGTSNFVVWRDTGEVDPIEGRKLLVKGRELYPFMDLTPVGI